MKYEIKIRNESPLDKDLMFFQKIPHGQNDPLSTAWQVISETRPPLREIDYRIDFNVHPSYSLGKVSVLAPVDGTPWVISLKPENGTPTLPEQDAEGKESSD
ncbi:hypothetical protein TUM18999_48910 [Pseudomonas tohonis]|uniref:Uncharacterized protein n=1 Tax=Pseudomonas tohonis TaxID=2725477 RepID=A0A6J4EAP6_9PSED|nr:hypothetical protein [Pseudomonas tohonis]BCG26700.1 hypothetical protein TUM18999_48910 [Pseudomonas tohonis]GJN50564.1 hypothetical protein TUM20286_03160 [Pseudomonas tohonis]